VKGELKKRIMPYVTEDSWDDGEGGGYTTNKVEISKILDEAKKELQSGRTHFSWISDERPIAATKYICIDYELFKKWFGDE